MPLLTMNVYQNLFYQYRGPQQSDDDFPRDRQLENNVTKALINVLHHTSDAGRAAVLSVLEAQPAGRALARRFRKGPLDLYLQRVPPDAKEATHRAVLLITGPGSAKVAQRLLSDGEGRPDAWLCARKNRTAVLVEAKLGAKVSEGQILRHLATVGWPRRTPVIRTTWADWFIAMDKVAKTQQLPPVHRFLLKQFLEYLEVAGMAPFTGFLPQDFDFFITYEPSYRPRLRQKLQQFGKLVYKRLDPQTRRRYCNLSVGNIQTEGGAAARLLRPDAPRHVRHCNPTIEINRDRLEFNAVIRDGRATDKHKPIGILNRRLRSAPQDFEEILHSLGCDYALSVFQRTRRDGSVPPTRVDERWNLVGLQNLAFVGEGVVNWLRFLINDIPFPGIHVGRHIHRGNPILQDLDRLVPEGVSSLHAAVRVLGYLEGT